MYEILIGLGVISLATFTVLLFIDKELQYLSNIGINKSKFVSIGKYRFLIPAKMHRNGSISTFALSMAIVYYLVNLLGVILVILHFVIENDAIYIIGCSTLSLNLVILIAMMIKMSLNKDQEIIKKNSSNKSK
jgi:hypothetical protein